MSLCAVVVVLASMSIGNCAGTLQVTVSANADQRSIPTKSGNFEYGPSGFRVGKIVNNVDIGGQTFKDYCYVVMQEAFVNELEIPFPFPDGLTLDLTQAKQSLSVGRAPATGTSIGRVLLDAIVIMKDKMTQDLEKNVDIVAKGIARNLGEGFYVVKIKANGNETLLKELERCVLLAFTTGEFPCS